MGRGSGTLAVIGREVLGHSFLLAHLCHGDVTVEGQNSLPPKQAEISVLTLKGHYHYFHNFTVLYQPHSVEILYILNKNINATCNNLKDLTELQFI